MLITIRADMPGRNPVLVVLRLREPDRGPAGAARPGRSCRWRYRAGRARRPSRCPGDALDPAGNVRPGMPSSAMHRIARPGRGPSDPRGGWRRPRHCRGPAARCSGTACFAARVSPSWMVRRLTIPGDRRRIERVAQVELDGRSLAAACSRGCSKALERSVAMSGCNWAASARTTVA